MTGTPQFRTTVDAVLFVADGAGVDKLGDAASAVVAAARQYRRDGPADDAVVATWTAVEGGVEFSARVRSEQSASLPVMTRPGRRGGTADFGAVTVPDADPDPDPDAAMRRSIGAAERDGGQR